MSADAPSPPSPSELPPAIHVNMGRKTSAGEVLNPETPVVTDLGETSLFGIGTEVVPVGEGLPISINIDSPGTPEEESRVRVNMGRPASRVRVNMGRPASVLELTSGAVEPVPSEHVDSEAPPVSRVIRPSKSIHYDDKKGGDVLDLSEMPRSFLGMKPEGGVAKVMIDTDNRVELRQSSTKDHQDGVAFNPNNGTVVVCDGLGGVGSASEAKNYFAYGLAHATAEMEDISTLVDPEVVAKVLERTRTILESSGIKYEQSSSRISFGKNDAMASTIAAVQRIPDTNRWRVVTIGDSSVVRIGKDGKIVEGFGEAFQLIKAGMVDSKGMASDPPMSSVVAVGKDTFIPRVAYGSSRSGLYMGSEFTEVMLGEGEKLVLASDAYIQKSPPSTLEHDVEESADSWHRRAPNYSDDTTLAIVY